MKVKITESEIFFFLEPSQYEETYIGFFTRQIMLLCCKFQITELLIRILYIKNRLPNIFTIHI
jgi:hypothetical protein